MLVDVVFELEDEVLVLVGAEVIVDDAASLSSDFVAADDEAALVLVVKVVLGACFGPPASQYDARESSTSCG